MIKLSAEAAERDAAAAFELGFFKAAADVGVAAADMDRFYAVGLTKVAALPRLRPPQLEPEAALAAQLGQQVSRGRLQNAIREGLQNDSAFQRMGVQGLNPGQRARKLQADQAVADSIARGRPGDNPAPITVPNAAQAPTATGVQPPSTPTVAQTAGGAGAVANPGLDQAARFYGFRGVNAVPRTAEGASDALAHPRILNHFGEGTVTPMQRALNAPGVKPAIGAVAGAAGAAGSRALLDKASPAGSTTTAATPPALPPLPSIKPN